MYTIFAGGHLDQDVQDEHRIQVVLDVSQIQPPILVTPSFVLEAAIPATSILVVATAILKTPNQ